jgi:hypothetical protein
MRVIHNLSNEYIYLNYTGPPTFTSKIKKIGRCSIESKNEGGEDLLMFENFFNNVRFKLLYLLGMQLV